MSMNLHSNAIELWQTPSWITEVAMYDGQGNNRPVGEVIYIYSEWLKSTLNGVWTNYEELREARKQVKIHLEKLHNIEPHLLNFCTT